MRICLGLLASLLYASALPELPRVDTSNYLPVIRSQIEQAEAAVRSHPLDVGTAGALAMILHAYQQYEAAERVYERAHLLEPTNYDWLYLLGAVRMELGRYDIAAQSFRSALQSKPADLAAQWRLAESIAGLGDWEEAGKQYEEIVGRYSDFARAWYGLGRVRSARGDHAGAAESYAKACELFPLYSAAHFALAREFVRLGKRPEAEQQMAAYSARPGGEPPLDDPLFRRIHELNQSTTAHLQRGAELERAGYVAEAIREHETALATDPGNVQAHVNLISLYGRTGETQKAQRHFEDAIRLNPGRSDAWYGLGVLLSRERKYEEAARAYRNALQIDPHYAEAHLNLGVIYEQSGRLTEAGTEFRQAVAARPDNPAARFHLGRILVNQEKYPEAIQHFLRALTPETDQTPAYLYALGATYARSGDRARALEYLQKARDAAAAHSQPRLLASIDRDLKTLQAER